MKRTVLLAIFSCVVFFSFSQNKSFYFTTSDSVRLFVRVAGSGKPCVFVHGGPGSTSH